MALIKFESATGFPEADIDVSNNGNRIHLRYVGRSRIDGFPIYDVVFFNGESYSDFNYGFEFKSISLVLSLEDNIPTMGQSTLVVNSDRIFEKLFAKYGNTSKFDQECMDLISLGYLRLVDYQQFKIWHNIC